MTIVTTGTKRFNLPIDALHANPLNPRGPVDPETLGDLVASIRSQGLLQAILATPDGTIIAGHRRHAAAQLAGLAEVPVYVRDFPDDVQLELMLVENIQREDLNPLQEARAYAAMSAAGVGQIDIARRIGVSSARVQSRIVLLKLAPDVQAMFARYEVPITLAPVLARVGDWAMQERLAVLSARKGLRVSALEAIVDGNAGTFNQNDRPVRKSEGKPVGQTRGDLVALLNESPDLAINFRQLASLVGDVCCACGMTSVESVCAACPLPQLLVKVVA